MQTKTGFSGSLCSVWKLKMLTKDYFWIKAEMRRPDAKFTQESRTSTYSSYSSSWGTAVK